MQAEAKADWAKMAALVLPPPLLVSLLACCCCLQFQPSRGGQHLSARLAFVCSNTLISMGGALLSLPLLV
jgi:hypothetical protein